MGRYNNMWGKRPHVVATWGDYVRALDTKDNEVIVMQDIITLQKKISRRTTVLNCLLLPGKLRKLMAMDRGAASLEQARYRLRENLPGWQNQSFPGQGQRL